MNLSLLSLIAVFGLSPLVWTVGSVPPGITNGAPLAGAVAGTMPKQCQPGKTSPEGLGWHWRANTTVKVYFLKDSFSEAQAGALSRAVESWNTALSDTDSKVVFVLGGQRDVIARENASITVVRGIPRGQKRLGEIRFYSLSNGVMHMVITVSPVVTDTGAITSLMTHELGHSLGLADCYECRRGTTAMAAFLENNKGNKVYEPSECDRYVVAAGYAAEAGAQAKLIPGGAR